MAFLNNLDLRGLVSKEDLIRFAPIQAATALLSEFDEQDQHLLSRLLARGIRPVPTLEEIGQKMNLTRERVRQIEVNVANRLAQKIGADKYSAVKKHADALSAQLGTAFPVTDLPSELRPETEAVSYTHLDVYKRQGLSRLAASTASCNSGESLDWPRSMRILGVRPDRPSLRQS